MKDNHKESEASNDFEHNQIFHLILYTFYCTIVFTILVFFFLLYFKWIILPMFNFIWGA